MNKEFLVDVGKDMVRIAVLEKGIMNDLIIEYFQDQQLIGNLYKGRVNAVLPGMQAAFVDVGVGKDAFLPLTEPVEDILGEEEGNVIVGKIRKAIKKVFHVKKQLKRGQEILVQVTKDAVGKKGARLTTNISVTGRNLVFMPTVNHFGVSKKIVHGKERMRLRTIVKKIKKQGQGFIIRTAGEGKPLEEFQEEAKFLNNMWENVKQRASQLPTPSLVYEDLDMVLKVVRDNFLPGDKVIINSNFEYEKLMNFLQSMMPSMKGRVNLYKEHTPLFTAFNIEQQIEQALQRRVKLKSGGHIVIDEAEALTAIDVNTGKFIGGKNLEDTVFRTNMEAAVEIARQVRLRSIGGIIIVDFIDMEIRQNQEKVMRTFDEAFATDKAKVNIIPLTEIGLIEMTRRRMRPTLSRILCTTCPHCGGTGMLRKKSA
ncbi:MAG: Rne/Rng family ribonuclease [bacterium]|nr:Rne/Rng family ribonuclease [bacterium]MDD5354041.1 Rne/Rng family ribonuclease [bacterium]MDD5756100.1 Rne/Rng family ribonuclease [bacterium]